MAKKRQQIDTSGASSAPLGSLAHIFADAGFAAAPSTVPSADVLAENTPSDSQADLATVLSSQKVPKFQLERKGRGGKTVTIISGYQLNQLVLSQLACALGKSLGCGASVQGTSPHGQIVLQGDQRDRARQFLLRISQPDR